MIAFALLAGERAIGCRTVGQAGDTADAYRSRLPASAATVGPHGRPSRSREPRQVTSRSPPSSRDARVAAAAGDDRSTAEPAAAVDVARALAGRAAAAIDTSLFHRPRSLPREPPRSRPSLIRSASAIASVRPPSRRRAVASAAERSGRRRQSRRPRASGDAASSNVARVSIATSASITAATRSAVAIPSRLDQICVGVQSCQRKRSASRDRLVAICRTPDREHVHSAYPSGDAALRHYDVAFRASRPDRRGRGR